MESREAVADVIQDVRFVRTEEVGCPLCGEPRPSRRIPVRFGMQAYVAECPSCRIGFQTPRPSPEATLAYMDWRWQSSDTYVADVEDQRRRARKQVEIVQRYAPSPRRVLDVGAGAGSFVRAALDQGWDALGVERSGSAISRAAELHGVELVQDIPREQFDVVTLWDVIEHIRNPEEFLRMLREHLADDGCLFVETGNLESWVREWTRDRWQLYLFDHHYYFSPSSLHQILRRAGYAWSALVDTNHVRPPLNPLHALRRPVRTALAWRTWNETRRRWPHHEISVMVMVARKDAPPAST